MEIKSIDNGDWEEIMKMAKKLHPEWFDNFAINESLPLDLRVHRGLVAWDSGRVLGFLTYTSRQGKIYLTWMGVDPDHRRKGIGTELFKEFKNRMERIGVKEARVETVADTEDYKPYKGTRDFYQKVGFKFEKARKEKSRDTGKEFDMATFLVKF